MIELMESVKGAMERSASTRPEEANLGDVSPRPLVNEENGSERRRSSMAISRQKRMDMAVLLELAHDEVKYLTQLVATDKRDDNVAERVRHMTEALRRVHEQHRTLTFFKVATWEAKISKLMEAGHLTAKAVEEHIVQQNWPDGGEYIEQLRARIAELESVKKGISTAFSDTEAISKFEAFTAEHQVAEDRSLHERVEELGGREAAADIFREEISAVDVESTAANIDVKKNLYYGSIRIRNVYFIVTTSLLIIGILVGLFVQILFEIYINMGHRNFKQFFRLSTLPCFVVLIALVGDELADLTYDSFNLPTTSWSRAVSVVAMHDIAERLGFFGRKHHFRVLALQDFLDAFLMDIFMVGGFLNRFLGTFDLDKSIRWMICGGIIWAVITVTRVIVCDMYINYRQSADPNILGLSETMQDAIMHHGIRAGRLRHELSIITAYISSENKLAEVMPEESLEGKPELLGFHIRYREKAAEFEKEPKDEAALKHLFAGAGVWFVCVIFSWAMQVESNMLFAIAVVLLVFTVFCLSRALMLKLPNAVGPAFIAILFLLGFLAIILFLSHVALNDQQSQESHQTEDRTNSDEPQAVVLAHPIFPEFINETHNPNGLPRGYENMETTVYPVCRMRWGKHLSEIGILDLALLSAYSYNEEVAAYRDVVNRTFFGAEGLAKVETLVVTDYHSVPRWTAVKFTPYLHAPPRGRPQGGAARESWWSRWGHHENTATATQGPDSEERDVVDYDNPTIVVTIKGTSTVRDIFTDLSLFSIIQVLQMLSNVFPILSIIPQMTSAWLLQTLRFGGIAEDENALFLELESNIRQLKDAHPNASFIITGHSLGGGLAEVIGAQLGLPAVVFSAPGTELSHRRFNMSTHATTRTVVGVRPESDPVPGVDYHTDMVQNIACREPDGSARFFLNCHLVGSTTCELWRACGDFRHRDFSDFCGDYVGADTMGRYWDGLHIPGPNDVFNQNPRRLDQSL